MRTIFRFLVASSALLLCASCFEDPIPEKLILEFHQDSTVTVTSSVEFLDATDFDSRALRRRVERVRAEFANQTDLWSRRFSGASFQKEKFSVEKSMGKITRVDRSGVLPYAHLQRLLADTDLTITVIEGDGWRELAIVPGTSTRASVQQRNELLNSLDQWSRQIAEHQRALEKIYRYIETHPDRAPVLIGAILEHFLTEEDQAALEKPSAAEEELLEDLDESKPLDALSAADAKEYSLDELSSLVYDPFPAELTVRLSGQILESEGFEPAGENTVRVLPLRLMNALESLQTLWITPDPLVALVNAARVEQEPISLAAFLARERRIVAVPTPAMVRSAIEERLIRLPVYRVRWRD